MMVEIKSVFVVVIQINHDCCEQFFTRKFLIIFAGRLDSDNNSGEAFRIGESISDGLTHVWVCLGLQFKFIYLVVYVNKVALIWAEMG